jgi:Protein of unknown function (DUF2948)
VPLKLKAEDAEDLKVFSAHLQDALVRVGDIGYLPRKHRLAMTLNRFCWEAPPAKVAGKDAYARVTAGVHFDGVLSVKTRGLDRNNPEGLLYLLALEPHIDADGAGTIELVFAGGASIIAEVECIDASLFDLGEPWLTENRPMHEAGEGAALR